MKAADGTKIAEIVRYWTTCEDGIHGLDPAPQGKGNWVRYTDHLAALSAAEERERVLREALGNLVAALKLGGYMKRGHFYYYGVADPAMTKPFNDACALATPAPEQ